ARRGRLAALQSADPGAGATACIAGTVPARRHAEPARQIAPPDRVPCVADRNATRQCAGNRDALRPGAARRATFLARPCGTRCRPIAVRLHGRARRARRLARTRRDAHRAGALVQHLRRLPALRRSGKGMAPATRMNAHVLPRTTIIGAGLVGSLLATLLAQRGFPVEMFERRPDPRVHGFLGGRSINLALAERGLNALRKAGLADAVLAQAVMMRGRMVHPLDGGANLQRYGLDDSEVIRSVSRGNLNILLLDAAERAGATLHFDAALAAVDYANATITLASQDGRSRTHACGLLLG